MCSKFSSPKRRTGFTLVELLVTMGVGSIVMMAIASLSLYTGRSFATMANYVDLDNASRAALDIMTSDIRQATFLDSFATNRLTFTDYDGGELVFEYNTTAKTLSRIKGDVTKVLLRECDELVFRMYQRNFIPGSYDLVSTTNSALCKAVDVSWTCSRRILGSRLNTESVQTARVVIRKQQD
jgi:prepilin-type N-terminal cleavage/methylation domain-containing protein